MSNKQRFSDKPRRPGDSSYRIGFIAGDGIGPEVVASALAVARAAATTHGVELEWLEVPAAEVALRDTGDALPQSSIHELERCDGFLLGPVDHATYPLRPDGRRQNPSGELRSHFDLYANLRPSKTFIGVDGVVQNPVDLLIVRENTEGFYADRNMLRGSGELLPVRDVVLTIGVFSRSGISRVTRAAYELAAARRGHLTVVHKANVLPESTGMFVTIARELQEEFPSVVLDDLHVDAAAAHLVRHPEKFDVIVTENLFGDILSDLAGELIGSLGLAPSLNVGDRHAMAQAAHGSAPDIAGMGIANPVAMILSLAMLFEWIGKRHDDSDLIDMKEAITDAVGRVLPVLATPDLGGRASSNEFTAELVRVVSTDGERRT